MKNRYEWKIVYLDLAALQLVLRHTRGDRRLLPMIIFDTAHYHDWKVNDLVAVDAGAMSKGREIQKQMGMRMSEEDYTLRNQRTGTSAPVRKNDYECDNAFEWLEELKSKGLIAPLEKAED